MIKYVKLDQNGFVQTNSDTDFEGATKVIFQDDWLNDFNKFYDKFYVDDSGVVKHPDNLPTDPITQELSDLKDKAKSSKEALEDANKTIEGLTSDNKDLSQKVQSLSAGNQKAMNMISYMYGNFSEFQSKLEEKQDKDKSNASNDNKQSNNDSSQQNNQVQQ